MGVFFRVDNENDHADDKIYSEIKKGNFFAMKDSLVSIIIPAYNAVKYIKEAVDSALGQTHKNIEVIVVDDGSTDSTKKILEPYIAARKIIYIYQTNKGLAGARNAGIKNSSGKYIAFLDADDLFLPEKVAEQVGILEKNAGYGVCYSDLLHFDEKGNVYHHRYKYPSGDVLEPLLRKQLINPLTVMARRDLFEKYGYFDEKLRRSEDWDMWLRWAHAGVKFYYLDKILARYRIRSADNLSSLESEPEMKEKNFEIFSRLGEKLTKEQWQKYRFDDVLKKLRLKVALAHLMVGDKKGALAYVKDSPLRQFLIVFFPAKFYRAVLVFARKIKHRLLLRKR